MNFGSCTGLNEAVGVPAPRIRRAVAIIVLAALLLFYALDTAVAQVYSPKVLVKGQVDATNLTTLAEGIYRQAGATTQRQKAEAIWRFFLTDGRYVPPGFWYHIAGWAYEEPEGEVLDPVKLLNSYGFGLCYHIAPLLQAVFLAGGFEDARVWFLTGHTVTEVFYDGAYHHYDSDMLGYTSVGDGNPRTLPVASVSQIAHDGNIMLSKLKSPTSVDASKVDYPWYPADLRAAAIGDLVSAFTSTNDNWLYSSTRFPQGHSMDFVLRPGERLTRFFRPESKGLFYLPYKFDGKGWAEFPQEISEYSIRTEDGPQSQKDDRRWATGLLEYSPPLLDPASYLFGDRPGLSENIRIPAGDGIEDCLSRVNAQLPARAVFDMQSAYVLIDAQVSLDARLRDAGQAVTAEVSVDGGMSWEEMSRLSGPHSGSWTVRPVEKVRSEHGSLTSVGGKYQYLIRLTMTGPGAPDEIQMRNVRIASRFQLNPRTLPSLGPGRNDLSYSPGRAVKRTVMPVQVDRIPECATRAVSVRCVTEKGQGILWPEDSAAAEIVFELSAPDGSSISGFDVGGRFLDLRENLAPDKLAAETRTTRLGERAGGKAEASIAWSLDPDKDYKELWVYNPELRWRDGKPEAQVLRWPEVDRRVDSLPAGTKKAFIRYRLKGMGMDSPRLAVLSPRPESTSSLVITHRWSSGGQVKEQIERIEDPRLPRGYRVDVPAGANVINEAVIFYCPTTTAR